MNLRIKMLRFPAGCSQETIICGRVLSRICGRRRPAARNRLCTALYWYGQSSRSMAMMEERSLAFASASPSTALPPTYSLLTLPPSLVALLTNPATADSLEIRGHTTDAAVLVTPTQTFALRGVQNSNSLCLCSSGIQGGENGKGWFAEESASGAVADEAETSNRTRLGISSEDSIEIFGVLHETLEVNVAVAKLERLANFLKPGEYFGQDAEETRESPAAEQNLFTFDSLRSLLPASDFEIQQALDKNRVVEFNNYLRKIPPSFLLTVLPALLKSLPSNELEAEETQNFAEEADAPIKAEPFAKNGKPIRANSLRDKGKGKEKADLYGIEASVQQVEVVADFQEMLEILDAVDCHKQVAQGIVKWFGQPSAADRTNWEIRIDLIVKEIGICLLAAGGFTAQKLDPFIAQWKSLCASYSSLCTIALISDTVLTNLSIPPTITFLPASHLSADPATRFAELFSLKPRWKDSEMIKFLDDLVAGDKKKRDAMVLKFVRKVKESDNSTSWTARNLW